MTRLLCPACGARVRACSERAREMHGWAYACLACGHMTDHPIALADSRTIKRWCREEDTLEQSRVDPEYGPESEPDQAVGSGWDAFFEAAGRAYRAEEEARAMLRDVDCDPDAARRARIAPALQLSGGDNGED